MGINNTRAVFEATAGSYDQNRMTLIPGHQRFYGAALSLIPQDARRVVDLGAGTGLFSAMVHGTHPEAELHLIDFSPKMLALAQARLGALETVRYVLDDYVTAALPEDSDAVVTALSVHHLDDEQKRALFHNVLKSLRPGGRFINADHIAGPSSELEREYQERWLEAVRAQGASEQQIADSLFRQQEDRRSPIASQLGWMRDAGFVQVDCWHKDNSFAVMTGCKPA